MKNINSSLVEYQGISIIRKDITVFDKILKDLFVDQKLTIRPNLHVCLDYFGIKRQTDAHIEKERRLFPENCMGKQVTLQLLGVGYFTRDNELMNVAVMLDDSVYYDYSIGTKTLAEYNHVNMPWVTIYTNPKKVIDSKTSLEKPITSAKYSNKCFHPDQLAENEKMEFIEFEEPIQVTGELCAFYHVHKIFRVQNNSTRLVTNRLLRVNSAELLNMEFENDFKKEKMKKEELMKEQVEKIFQKE